MRQIALGLIVTGLIATPAWAEEAGGTSLKLNGALRGVSLTAAAATPRATAQAADETPTVSGVVGADFPFGGGYFFRGYRQETDPAFTFQPFVDVAIAGESASFNIGSWNSIHTGSLSDQDASFYETDFYVAATVGKIKATYTAYMYPGFNDDTLATIHELMLSTTFDHKLAPSVAVAFEFAKPEGVDKGVYAEFGIAPAVPMADDAPISITIPIKIGLSLKDYYFNEEGDNAPLGYVSGGLMIGHKVSDKLEIHGGVTVYGLTSESTKGFNNGDSAAFVASVGLSTSF
jgi:hypothetical protein